MAFISDRFRSNPTARLASLDRRVACRYVGCAGLGKVNVTGMRSDRVTTRTAYELAEEAGLIGCVRRAPKDLSTNRHYIEDFGKGSTKLARPPASR